ncbi:response regulator [Cypionkella sp.]|jgi:two-component system, chemotaxis family, chemotaxis protein CheY|uniref:response regulator n=1 Tax=Cypionkella sp. TaxID=2811411 RepID=UPI002FDEAB04
MAKTILTIDDSKAIRDMVGLTLRGAGYRVIEAANGAEGITQLQAETVALVIVDLNMPVMNGIDFIRNARRDPKGIGVPIVMLTTETKAELKAEGKAAGATGWLNKPFDADMLLAVTKKLAG